MLRPSTWRCRLTRACFFAPHHFCVRDPSWHAPCRCAGLRHAAATSDVLHALACTRTLRSARRLTLPHGFRAAVHHCRASIIRTAPTIAEPPPSVLTPLQSLHQPRQRQHQLCARQPPPQATGASHGGGVRVSCVRVRRMRRRAHIGVVLCCVTVTRTMCCSCGASWQCSLSRYCVLLGFLSGFRSVRVVCSCVLLVMGRCHSCALMDCFQFAVSAPVRSLPAIAVRMKR